MASGQSAIRAQGVSGSGAALNLTLQANGPGTGCTGAPAPVRGPFLVAMWWNGNTPAPVVVTLTDSNARVIGRGTVTANALLAAFTIGVTPPLAFADSDPLNGGVSALSGVAAPLPLDQIAFPLTLNIAAAAGLTVNCTVASICPT